MSIPTSVRASSAPRTASSPASTTAGNEMTGQVTRLSVAFSAVQRDGGPR